MIGNPKFVGITAAVGLALLLGIAASAAIQQGEREAFQSAKNLNLIDGWESFLKNFPNGETAKEARQALDDLLGREADKASADPGALAALFRRCKTAEGSDRVFRLWDEALWNAALKSDTKEALQEYLLRFPGGAHVKEAKAAKDEKSWRYCLAQGKLESYKAYLTEYESGAHAKEAKAVVRSLEFMAAGETGTIEAYTAFLKSHPGHTEASQRLRQLRYQKALNEGTFEAWKSFFDDYRYSIWPGDGPEAETMKSNALREVERLLYERIAAAPTLELCRDYLKRYPGGLHERQVVLKMEPFLFEEAMRADKAEGYLEYLEKYPDGERVAAAVKGLDAIVFRKPEDRESFSAFDRYLRALPKDRDRILAAMESLMFEWAERVGTVESRQRYLDRYPEGAHRQAVQAGLESSQFNKAREEDWFSAYEEYLKKCPDGARAEEVRQRLAWLKDNPAQVEIEFPRIVEGSGYWSWITAFKEKSGKSGFRLSGSGYILDINGGKWGTNGYQISRGTVQAKGGGTAKDDYWVRSSDHGLCNGEAVFEWVGQDAGGHPLRFDVRVRLQHMDCPKSVKK
ncbi:MAG: hypothetical protein WCI75_11100 [candidate division NC10 bacterium]